MKPTIIKLHYSLTNSRVRSQKWTPQKDYMNIIRGGLGACPLGNFGILDVISVTVWSTS